MSLRAQVLAALAAVHDPELDEPITTLGFVGSCVVGPDGAADVRLRLPTPQCAPNFAYLMLAEARAAVLGVPGVGAARVVLEDHYTADELNGAVSAGAGFTGAFPGETAGDVEALRALFWRKALLARQGRLLGTVPDPAAARLGDLRGPEADRCRVLRRSLGIDAADDAPAFVRGDGTPLGADEVPRFKRLATLASLSLEANGGICRDLLRVRHGAPDPEEVAA